MYEDDSSSDSEADFKRKLVLMQFVPADDSDEYEIVDNPLSDNEDDPIDYNRYDTDKELQRIDPVARLQRAYNIRGYPDYRKEEVKDEDGKWHCRILIGENKIYEAINQNQYDAYHLAAINFMKDLIKENESWMTQLGLPHDISRCNKILDDKFEDILSKSKKEEEIGDKDPKSFLYEFCSFYKSKIIIKEPAYKYNEVKNENGGNPKFCCNGIFRGTEFSAIGSSKKAAQTEVARMFVKKLKEKNEIRPFFEDREKLQRGNNFKGHVLHEHKGETQQTFDQYFQNDPYHYAKIWQVYCIYFSFINAFIFSNGGEPEIEIDNEKDGIIITCRGYAMFIKSKKKKGKKLKLCQVLRRIFPCLGCVDTDDFTAKSKEEAKKEWATRFLRKAFVDRYAPDFFDSHLPEEMIDLLNDSFHEITIPKPWENEER
uniref:DRBM domain-containing protein n=1 Tax=Panagrolaimus sp. ES5 TaxID=591445 RepID=A0AC34GQR4_9BILA